MAVLFGLIIAIGVNTVAGQGDAWLMNITSSVYGLPWNHAEALSNKNSSRFREEQNFFCGRMNDIFQADPVIGNPVKERYVRCFIDSFQKSNVHTEAPVAVTYSLLFNGTDPVPKPIVDGLMAGNTETYHFGNRVWSLIGEWLISRVNVELVRVNLSDYMTSEVETGNHVNMEISTVVSLTADLVNFTMTPGISDPTSAEFSALSNSFCKEVAGYLTKVFPSYKSCIVSSIVNNSVEERIIINIQLAFGFENDIVYPQMVASLIAERAPRLTIGNQTVLNIGPVMISETSWFSNLPGTVQDARDRPDANPCLLYKSNTVLPDPVDPTGYIICIRDSYIRFNCDKGQMFDSSANKCV